MIIMIELKYGARKVWCFAYPLFMKLGSAYVMCVCVCVRCVGDKLRYDLLRRHWLAYFLLAVMCLTNLELLTLFPWDYSKFPLAAHLDGYPSPM